MGGRPLAFRAHLGQKRAPVPAFDFDHAFRHQPVFLAPMEDVTDEVFRKLCRARGVSLCVTEFVNVEGLLRGSRVAQRKIDLAPDDHPTAIQIYGADAGRLAEAAEVAERSQPAWLDINCGCWVPKVARRGAGAGWLRDPLGMVAMVKMVVERVKLPVTVKTRLGYDGTVSRGEGSALAPGASEMPIVELAKRLEDVGARALTLHCRTAEMAQSIVVGLYPTLQVSAALVERTKTQCSILGDCARLENAHGVSDAVIAKAVKLGINKINVDSDLRIAFTAAVRETLINDKKAFDPRKILGPAKKLMKEVVKHKMELFGSAGKA